MATIRKTITLTAQQDAWIKAQIDIGEFTNDSEYIRNLIRQDQEQNARYLALKNAVQNHRHEDISRRTVAEVWEAAGQYQNNEHQTAKSAKRSVTRRSKSKERL